MPVKKCSFRNCESNSSNNVNLAFFRFSSINLREWVEACDSPKLNSISSKAILTQKYYVCEKHFSPLDYYRILSPFKKRLKRNVVPKDINRKYLASLLVCI